MLIIKRRGLLTPIPSPWPFPRFAGERRFSLENYNTFSNTSTPSGLPMAINPSGLIMVIVW